MILTTCVVLGSEDSYKAKTDMELEAFSIARPKNLLSATGKMTFVSMKA
jgi:hypothetical protein